ncbi:MAG: hypothetical protein J1G02_04755 [Clostridiales bacterium]|nr:hypothetical protein [Clostridiales bacterium]
MKTYPKYSWLNKCLAFVLLLSLTVCFSACGIYIGPNGPGVSNGPNNGGDEIDESTLFTVDLMLNGKQFTPPIEMYAQWTGDDGIHNAKFDENGHAQTSGLDGDYHVTLSAVPDGYTYDPNGYAVDNNHRSIEIEMLQIIPTTGKGDGMYNCIKISRLGTYRTTLNNANHAVFYEYAPYLQGSYSIQSWVDIYENEVNPIMEVYNGTTQFKFFNRTQDGGGTSSTYTKNFKLELELSSDMIGNVWTFQVHADCRSGNYPITIDFTIKLEDDFQGSNEHYENYYASGPFYDASIHGAVSGTRRYLYDDTNKILDASKVKLNPADKFYHVYDETLYSDTNGFGPILFTYLGVDFSILSTNSGKGFMDDLVRGWLRFNGKRYWWDIDNGNNVWDTDPNCFLAQYVSHGVDGGHPVTEELKTFLFEYALSQRMFIDGNGWAEGAGLKSSEENQWLFNCYYYVQ